jgi:hypothetical protein
MTGNASPTKLAKLAIGTGDPVTDALNYADFDPGVRIDLRDVNRTTGRFTKTGNRVVDVAHPVTPRLSMEPTAAELSKLLRWLLWGVPTGAGVVTYPIGDTPEVRNIYYAPKKGEQWWLPGVAVNEFNIRASQGEPLSLDVSLLGKTYDTTRDNFPALAVESVTRPFTLARMVLTVAGVARNCRGFTLTVSHALDVGRMLNSLTLTDYVKTDQVITVGIEVPSGENPGLWNVGLTGATVLASFTNGFGGAFSMSFSDIRFGPQSPSHGGTEGFLSLSGEAYGVGSGEPFTITLNAAG